MLKEANMKINPEIDVLVNDRQYGYRFSDKIVVVDGQELSVPNQKNGKTKDIPNWILSEIQKSGRVRRKQITLRTGHSESTIRRNLVKLRKEGRIVFEGSSRSGYWRLV